MITPYQFGYKARKDGVAFGDNPFGNHGNWMAWNEGWLKADTDLWIEGQHTR